MRNLFATDQASERFASRRNTDSVGSSISGPFPCATADCNTLSTGCLRKLTDNLLTSGLIFVAAFTLGCRSTPKAPDLRVWYQTGKTDAEVRQAEAECKFAAAQGNNPLAMANAGFWLANEINKKEMIHNCMIAKGYTFGIPPTQP
jgi:hypothetical protein